MARSAVAGSSGVANVSLKKSKARPLITGNSRDLQGETNRRLVGFPKVNVAKGYTTASDIRDTGKYVGSSTGDNRGQRVNRVLNFSRQSDVSGHKAWCLPSDWSYIINILALL